MPGLRKPIQNEDGFTLVELMVTVLLTAIAVISIYRGYTSFSQAADAQQQLMEMQQNLRIGMSWLAKDIRETGMNEENNTVARFLYADESEIEFSMDLGSANGPVLFASDTADNDDDGLTDEDDESRIGDGDDYDDGERIHYYLDDEDVNDNGVLDPGEDLNNNGLIDQWLMREVWVGDPLLAGAPGGYGTPPQKVIDNVEALNFVYYDSGSTSPPAAPAIMTIPAGGITDPIELAKISRVEITLVVRTTNQDYRYTDIEEYKNLQDQTVFDAKSLTVDDEKHLRRRAFTMVLDIRNNI